MSKTQVVVLTIKEYRQIKQDADKQGISVKEYLARQYDPKPEEIEVKISYKLEIPEDVYITLERIGADLDPTLTIKELITRGIKNYLID